VSLGKPTDIVLSYHYTYEATMASIRANGLMNHEERAAHGLKPIKEHGHSLGTGIYTAATPYYAASGNYGHVGLVVACLPGANAGSGASEIGSADSLSFVYRCGETVIVSCAKQCIPILQFQAKQIDAQNREHEGNVVLARYHSKLQQILEDTFASAQGA
jgi:hypothetical protein